MSLNIFKKRFFLLVVFPLLVILFSLGYYYSLGKYVMTENAYIKAPIIKIQSEVSGKVRKVFIKNNQFVRKNEKLLEIDTERLNIQLIEQKEILNTTAEEINNRKAKILELEEEIKLFQNNLTFRKNEIIRVKKLHKNQILLAEEKLEFLKKEYFRNKLLVKNGVGLITKLDSSKHLYENAKHDLASLKLKKDLDETEHLYESAFQKLKLIKKKKETILTKLMGKRNLVVTEHPLYQKNLAILNQIKLKLKKSKIIADESGYIGQMNLESGEFIKQGQNLFVIIEQSKIYLEANLKETQMTNIEVGQKATFVPDTFPDLKWNAIVESISPATGSEFAILPAQNSSGNWVKVVQRLPVRFKILEPTEKNNLKYASKKLRLGMTVSVKIDTEFERKVPIILKPFSKIFDIL